MMNVHDHYQRMKHVISADKPNPEKSLDLIKDDFFDNIKNIVLDHQQWHKDRKVCSCLIHHLCICIVHDWLDMGEGVERQPCVVATSCETKIWRAQFL